MLNNKCNRSYEEVMKKIEMERGKYKYLYIPGPKGEPGKDGSSTVRVGDTITGDEGTDAFVENVGTDKDAILKFTIPRGSRGNADTVSLGDTYTLDSNARAKVVDRGQGNNHIFDFYIPQGFDGVDGKSETVKVSGTETVSSDEDAKVVDEFIDGVHNLTFSIPKGETGPKGEIGPVGETGKSEGIKVAGTETISSGEDAKVVDNFVEGVHNLTFSIPKGETGPKGDTGDVMVDSYANLYEASGNTYSLRPNVSNQVELSTVGLNKNVDTSFTHTVRAKKDGIYKIDYFFAALSSGASDISIEARKESVSINGSKMMKSVKADEFVSFNGSVIVSVNTGEKIDLAITSNQSVNLTPKEDVVSYLNVMKIG